MTYIEDNARTGRIILPDLVRAFALFGIVLVNVAYFAYPGEVTYHAGGLTNGLDKSAYFAINSLFLFKSYTLFSFMFGVGLVYQMMSAERQGISFGPRYFRRMLGLILLGILHVSVAFVGDILIVYGVLGMFLFLFRNSSQKLLFRLGIFFVIFQVLISLFFAGGMTAFANFDPDNFKLMTEEMSASMETGTAIYQSGGFGDVMARRWTEWSAYIAFAGPLQAPGVFGFFLLGLAGVRAGILSDVRAKIWSTARRIYLPLGIVLSVIGTYLYMTAGNPMTGQAMLGTSIILIGAPFSSLGYIGWIAKWSDGPITPIKTFFARGGTASLTVYLFQSLILSWVFCGYGLGLYSKIGAFYCIFIAIVTGLITLSFASVWRTKFKRGPMEVLLRRWTYLGTR